MCEGCPFGAGGLGSVANGPASTGDEWTIESVARREQDRKRRKHSVVSAIFGGLVAAVRVQGFTDLNCYFQANATSVKESIISRTAESIEVRLNYI
jgi:hypothetical protein